MVTVKLDREYQIPTRWDELTPKDGDRFVSLCAAMHDAETGKDSFDEFRCRVVFALLGLDMAKVKDITPEFEENVFRLTELVTFPWRTSTKDGVITFDMDVILRRNLLPKIGGRKGYVFSITQGGVTDCDITAEQYIDTVQLLQVFSRNSSMESLSRLCDTLYGQGAGKDFSDAEKLAVYYNIRGILEWIKLLPDYALIFRGSSRPSTAPASPLGLSGSIFQLVKAGYGSLEDIRGLDLFSYLGLLVQMTVDSINAMKAQRVKPVDTADRLHLPVDLVTPYYEIENDTQADF